MKTSKEILLIAGAFVFVALFRLVDAAGFPEKSGYWIDSRGNVIRDTYNECWRAGYWTPALAIAECDPDLVMKESPKAGPPQTPPPPPVAAPAPPPPPPPAPAAVVPAPVPAVMVSLSAETLFDFDRAVIRPEGKKILEEKIVAGMKQHPEIGLLVITGHADRIGTEEYNQHLSERRARAVKDFLVTQGIAADRMTAVGKGETEPDSAANTTQTCKGKHGQKLIACLQPDRRVTVVSQGKAGGK